MKIHATSRRFLAQAVTADAAQARWFPIAETHAMAFDRKRIVRVALERLHAKDRHFLSGSELPPEKFTLTEIQRLYEAILGRAVDKRSFRKKLLGLGILKALERQADVALHATGLGLKFL